MIDNNRLTMANLQQCGLRVVLAAALATPCALAQTQPALTDAQAVLLIQALAKGQDGSTALSAAQMQALSLYLQRESQTAPAAAGANLVNAQAMLARSQAAAAAGMLSGAPPTPAMAPVNAASAVSPVAPAAALGAKKPGIVRIGIAQPKAQMGQGNTGVNVAEPLRSAMIQYLGGPALEVVPIAAMLPTQIDAEMKQKECDYVLYSSISQKMNGGSFGMLQKAMPFASMIPMVGMAGGMAGAVAGTAAGAAMSGAAGMTGSIKAKSEVTLEYRLLAAGSSAPVLANSMKAKAKQDGEDIVTPLIEQAAGAILAKVQEKK